MMQTCYSFSEGGSDWSSSDEETSQHPLRLPAAPIQTTAVHHEGVVR